MAKKKSTTDTIIKGLKSTGMLAAIKAKIDEVIVVVQEEVEEMRKRLVKSLTAAFLVLLGLIFLIYGLGLYLESVTRWPQGVSFMIIGGCAFVLALLIRYVHLGKK